MSFLEDSDIVTSDTWCRPLYTSHAGGWKDPVIATGFAGGPINNPLWVQVKYVLGSIWWDKTVEELSTQLSDGPELDSYEFASSVPERHKMTVDPNWVNLEKFAL